MPQQEAPLLQVRSRPEATLGRPGDMRSPRDSFWTSRALREGSGAPNFHHAPALGIGVFVVGRRAVLSVPSAEHFNRVSQNLHPSGGFRFADKPGADGFDTADEYLKSMGSGVQSISRGNDHPISYFDFATLAARGITIGSTMTEQKRDVPFTTKFGNKLDLRIDDERLVTTVSVHDIVDHMGAVAMSPELVTDLRNVGKCGGRLFGEAKDMVTRRADLLSSAYSALALTPAQPETPQEFLVQFTTMSMITSAATDINEITHASGVGIDIDFDRELESIARLQAMPAPAELAAALR